MLRLEITTEVLHSRRRDDALTMKWSERVRKSQYASFDLWDNHKDATLILVLTDARFHADTRILCNVVDMIHPL